MVELKKDIIIRMPLIPGYTDDMENIRVIGNFLDSLGKNRVKEIDLLPYHKGGIIKYEMLGREYPLGNGIEPQDDEYLQEVKQTLNSILGESCVVNTGR